MNAIDELAYRDPAKAIAVVDAAITARMTVTEVATFLGVGRAAIATWRAGEVRTLRPGTARKVMELDRRVERIGRGE